MIYKVAPYGLKRVDLNMAMSRLLGDVAETCWLAAAEPPPNLRGKLENGFEWNETKLIYRGAKIVLPGENDTGFEFFGSKIYLVDSLGRNGSKQTNDVLARGFGYAFALAETLFKYTDEFRVYVVMHPKVENEDLDDCCVQFHLERPGEDPPVDADQINVPTYFNPTAILHFSRARV